MTTGETVDLLCRPVARHAQPRRDGLREITGGVEHRRSATPIHAGATAPAKLQGRDHQKGSATSRVEREPGAPQDLEERRTFVLTEQLTTGRRHCAPSGPRWRLSDVPLIARRWFLDRIATHVWPRGDSQALFEGNFTDTRHGAQGVRRQLIRPSNKYKTLQISEPVRWTSNDPRAASPVRRALPLIISPSRQQQRVVLPSGGISSLAASCDGCQHGDRHERLTRSTKRTEQLEGALRIWWQGDDEPTCAAVSEARRSGHDDEPCAVNSETVKVESDAALATRLAVDAGHLLVRIREEMTGAGAPPWQVMDAGDLASHRYIVQELASARPDDAVLSEEGLEDPRRFNTDRVWIVDPLDGTNEFGELGRPDWAVHIALWDATSRRRSVSASQRST